MAISTRTGTALSGVATVTGKAKAAIATITGITLGGTPGADILDWPITETGGTAIVATAGPNGVTNGTLGGGTLTLNGTTQEAHSVSSVLYGAADQITVEIDFTNVSNTGTQIILESSDNWFSNDFAWAFYLDSGNLNFAIKQGGNFTLYHITAPTAGVARVAKIYYDASVAGGQIRFFLGGVEQTLTADANNISTGAFLNYVLNVGSRNQGSSFFCAITISKISISSGLI